MELKNYPEIDPDAGIDDGANEKARIAWRKHYKKKKLGQTKRYKKKNGDK